MGREVELMIYDDPVKDDVVEVAETVVCLIVAYGYLIVVTWDVFYLFFYFFFFFFLFFSFILRYILKRKL